MTWAEALWDGFWKARDLAHACRVEGDLDAFHRHMRRARGYLMDIRRNAK